MLQSSHWHAILICTLVSIVPAVVSAQTPGNRQNSLRQRQQMQQRMQEIAKSQPEFPSDPQLMSLHKEFIVKAEKLALEYERKKQLDKARDVYESLVRLVPKYAPAEEGLNRVLGNQKVRDRKLAEVKANQAWQDSGVTLQQGMPVQIKLNGTWKVVFETGPKGLQIPDELRPKDGRIKLGTLIGTIATSPQELAEGRPFILEDGKDFIAKKSGRLYLRMFDIDPSDNEGKIMVLVQSTFAN